MAYQPPDITSKKLLIVCRDVGGYVKRLSDYLAKNNEVTFVDLSAPRSQVSFLPGKLRRWLKKFLTVRAAHRQIQKAGKVDAVLIINPAQIDIALVDQAMVAAQQTIAFLSDGVRRLAMPVAQLARFDKVYTFDDADAREYGFRKLSNYIYELDAELETTREYKAFVVMAGKHRIDVLGRIAAEFDRLGHTNYKFLVQSKVVENSSPGITFFRERMSLDEVGDLIRRSEILIDIVRPGHAGLSFRFFDALFYRKKIITNNPSVMNYDFYDARNILVIDSEHPVIPPSFLVEEYIDPPADVVQKYSMSSWAREVFAPLADDQR
ncbi:hypothetical protein [Pseudomonas brassicacearum]|uniref:hypothetical protein n=1 Tax=Pseudomonas brassicacearum TaxID=930166 RepID=UPI001D407C8A|nr:hypothetical protein [Pseudomonas brassicacearum]CAH0307699.1 hypothetical protein SRABI06_04809 [Pseudomonas brassicacearum]